MPSQEFVCQEQRDASQPDAREGGDVSSKEEGWDDVRRRGGIQPTLAPEAPGSERQEGGLDGIPGTLAPLQGPSPATYSLVLAP